MDSLARNLSDLEGLVKDLTGRGVTVEFLRERQTFRPNAGDPMATLLLRLLCAVAQFERSLIRGRQREGIELAKAKGVYKGRAPKLTPDPAQEMKTKDRANGGKGRASLAREYGISRERCTSTSRTDFTCHRPSTCLDRLFQSRGLFSTRTKQ